MRIYIFQFIFLLLISLSGFSQSLPVGTPVLEDASRRAQLQGKLDPSVSFAIRPLFPQISGTDSSLIQDDHYLKGLTGTILWSNPKERGIKTLIKLLPITWKQQFNSHHPEGLNDGAMIPARGYQTMISGGFFAKTGWLSVQFKPEFVMAQNKAYKGFADEHPDAVWKTYQTNLNRIDLPERFGEDRYQKAFWGQSNISLTYRSVALSLSNENLWWGPGMQNALLMTNSAPGFKHLSFQSVKPMRTFIGSFEGQLVAGKLEASGFPNIDPQRLLIHQITAKVKPDDWRYFNGLVLSYQPKWLPGLFLGASRSFIMYEKDMGNGLTDYLPVIIPITKKSVGYREEDQIVRDQRASVFMRWMAPESHMEVYMEYGREDHNYDLTDLVLDPSHLRAYVLGFRKMTPLKNKKDEFIDIQVEITHLSKNVPTSIRAYGPGGWYLHGGVRHGYTHNGQYLGAGVGSGSNMQSMNISWVKNFKRLGMEFKRVAHNEDFWAIAFRDYRTHWVDLGGAAIGEWNYKQLLFNARVETVGSINYQFLYDPAPVDPPLWWNPGRITYNVHAELGVTYCF